MKTTNREQVEVPYDTGDYPRQRAGQIPAEDLFALHGALRSAARPIRRLLEIGTCEGLGLCQIRRMLPEVELHTMDLPPHLPSPPGLPEVQSSERMDAARLGHRARAAGVVYTQHLGDSRSLNLRALGRFDAVFVDGGHWESCVQADTSNALALLEPGGVIVWHDFGNPAVPDVEAVLRVVDARILGGGVCHIEGTTVAFWVSALTAACPVGSALRGKSSQGCG